MDGMGKSRDATTEGRGGRARLGGNAAGNALLFPCLIENVAAVPRWIPRKGRLSDWAFPSRGCAGWLRVRGTPRAR